MDKKELYKKRINSILIKACNELNIDIPKIRMNKYGQIHFSFNYFKDNTIINKRLNFDYKLMCRFATIKAKKMNISIWQVNKCDSISKRFKFIVCHELAHYFTLTKHLNWHMKAHYQNVNHLKGINPIDYRYLKLERIADKIAIYLIKKI